MKCLQTPTQFIEWSSIWSKLVKVKLDPSIFFFFNLYTQKHIVYGASAPSTLAFSKKKGIQANEIT